MTDNRASQRAEYERQYYKDHREEILARRKEQYAEKRVARAEYERQYRKDNAEKIRAQQKRRYYANHEKILETERKRYHSNKKGHKEIILRSRYGMAAGEFDKMYEAQGGKCLVCGQEKTLVVDHDHETSKVRGLLCNHCNTAIGLVKESPDIARKIAAYLEEHKGR